MKIRLPGLARLFAGKAPDARRTPVCIGHSHTEPLAAAAASSGTRLEILNFWHLPGAVTIEAGRTVLSPALRERLGPPVFSLIGGAVHQDVGLIQHARAFDVVLPGRPDLPLAQGAEIIPHGAVHAAMLARTQPYLDIMSAVRDAVQGAMFHMESPPTYADEQVPPDDPGFALFFGQGAAFSPAWLRYKLWRIHSDIVAEHCLRHGIVFVAHPAEAVDGTGFLLAAFHGTPAHANAAYGALVLAQLRQLAGLG